MDLDRALNDREPTRMKSRRRLSGDLDSILLKALRKEPERRYGSVQQFDDDIKRHLNGLPVTASKGNWSYTAGKFIARHRAAVAAIALLILALVAGIAATERQARIARCTAGAQWIGAGDRVRPLARRVGRDATGRPPSKQLIEDNSKRVDIARRCDRVSGNLLGAGILRRHRASHGRFGLPGSIEDLRNSEVQ
jgi:hypothetical protein